MTQILDIQIELRTAAAAEANFGLPLIAAYHTHYADRVRTYTDLDGLVDDGFALTSPTYLAASAMLAQSPHVSEFKVGRRALAYTQTFDLEPTDTTEGLVYKGTINGNAWEYTVQAADTVALIIDGIKTAIDGLSLALTTTDNTTSLTVAANTAGAWFALAGMNKELHIEDQTADPGIATDLAAIANADDDWYALLLDSQSKAEIVAAADYTAPRTKVLVANSADSAIYDSGSTTDVAATLQTNEEPRASLWYHQDPGSFLAAAFVSAHFVSDPGATNPAHRGLNSISASTLTTNERSNILAKNANIYAPSKGVNVTQFGTMADGEYLDNIRGADWLKDVIEAELMTLLRTEPKVPMTDGGIAAVEAAILSQLDRGVRSGFLAEDPRPSVSVPLASQVSAADKAARILRGVTFEATLANAINALVVRGVLTN